jgi:signal transduction histidine kinase
VDIFARQAADFIEDSRSREALRKLCANEQEARARADAANRRKDQFLATLSHELRQPLSAALPALEVQKRSLRPERRERAAEVIEQQLHHIARLVEDLSDVSHIARGIVDLRRERLDLRFIVRQALDMTMPLIDARRHRTTVTLGYQPTWVWVDGARMKQVFSNLLRNAASYTPPGGHISISLGRQDGRVFVRVRDNGIGIAADALGPIFEVFERGSQHTDSSSLGIGLAVARQIVALHGGSVSAASEGEGQGSEFVVTLPADEEPSNSS